MNPLSPSTILALATICVLSSVKLQAEPANPTASEPSASSSAAADANSPVRINFENPKKFRDANYQNRSRNTDEVTQDIADYFQKQGARYLTQGQTLEINVTDIDLAGRIEPWVFRNQDIRVMTRITWPRIELSYRLLDKNSAVLKQGQDKLEDKNYQSHIGRRAAQGRLLYEKAIIDKWFKKNFSEDQLASTSVLP